MSRKYTPSFLKDQPSQVESTNSFSPLSNNFPMNRERQLVNTSLPARQAPKLEPATLASLTGGGSTQPMITSGAPVPKGSFASKFAAKVKIQQDPNYVPPAKPIDLKSEDDFPSLGAPAKKIISPSKPIDNPEPTSTLSKGTNSSSFADLARGWAKKKEEEEEAERVRKAEEERLRRETQMMRRGINIMRFRQQTTYGYEDEEDDEYNDNGSISDDSFKVPSHDESSTDDEEEEFNGNLGYDRRHRDDLY
jgi:hypothetical protein